jgi:hypothetical protein
MTSHYTAAWRCRLLAAGAWVVAAAWFYFVLGGTWGFMLPSLLLWALVTIPLARRTRRWLEDAGRRPTGTGILMAAPVALLTVAITFPILSTDWHHHLAWVLLYITLGVSALGLVISLLAGTSRRSARSDQGASA